MIEDSKFRLVFQGVLKLIQSFCILAFVKVVKLEDFMSGEEHQFIAISIIEGKLNACLFKIKVSELLNLKFSLPIFLVNDYLSDLLLILDQESTETDANLLLILADSHVKDFDVVLLALGWNAPLLQQLEVVLIINTDIRSFSHDVGVH